MTQTPLTTKSLQKKSFDMSSNVYEYREEIEEVDPIPNDSLYYKVHKMLEKFATTNLGQFFMERTDNLLRTIEDTAKWSLPQDKQMIKLRRPLPWIAFLFLIIVLRMTRIWLSIAAVCIGNGPVTPQDVIYFIQTRRRKLRSVRIQGLKVLHSHIQQSSADSAESPSAGLLLNISELLSRAICRPGQQKEPATQLVFVQQSLEKNLLEKQTGHSVVKRPRDDETLDANLTANEMLAKYAAESSSDDSDFIPNAEDEAIVSDNTSNGTSSVSGESENESQNEEEPKEKSHHQKKASSVEIKENGKPTDMPNPIPLPMPIKSELTSDVDSDELLTPNEKSSSNGTANQDVDVVDELNSMKIRTASAEKKQFELMNGNMDNQRKSTPGHTSAAQMKPKMTSGFNPTATAGSPQDFNAFVQSVRKPITNINQSQTFEAQSTPKCVEDTETVEQQQNPSKKHVHYPQNQKSQQNQHHSSNRYRGNRRR